MRSLFFGFVAILLAGRPAFAGNTSLSVLFVVDNSGSMKHAREGLAKNAKAFVDLLRHHGVRSLRMGVTSTDVFTHAGALAATSAGLKIIDETVADPAAELAKLANAVEDTSTSFWEQGLEASYLALNGEAAALLRDGEPLAVVYISDEDDYSCEKECFGSEPENNPNWKAYPLDRYRLFFSTLGAKRRIEARLFPIVGVLEGSCTVASYGIRYVKMASVFGGSSGSVCPADFDHSFLKAAEKMADSSPGPDVPIVNPYPVVPDATERVPYTYDVLNLMVGGTGPFSFEKVSGPGWVALSPSGMITGTPSRPDIGLNQVEIRVCSGASGLCTVFEIGIAVKTPNQPPLWKVNPVPLTSAKVGSAYAADLSAFVVDKDGDPIVCSAIALPAWLLMGQNCTLYGTPGPADVGAFSAVVRATDSVGVGSDVTVTGSVLAH
jgi:hypothetical protein